MTSAISAGFQHGTVDLFLMAGDEGILEWSRLAEVLIVTTDQGPMLDDVFFLLRDADDNKLVVPQGKEPAGFLERLQRLPGFDNQAVIEAMTSTENAIFVCWRAA